MNNFCFKTPRPKSKKEKSISIVLEVLFCAFIIWMFFLTSLTMVRIYVITCILFLTIVAFYTRKYKTKYSDVFFVLTSDYIKIINDGNERLLNKTDVGEVVIKFKSKKGDNISWRAWYIPSTGHKNIINFLNKTGNISTHKILCLTDADYWRLKSLGFFLKEQGIEVKMKGFLM